MEETLGKRIVANRKRLGLTQDQLAEKLGVTPQAVSKWENDQSCPDITVLPLLADIFEITVDALLGRQNDSAVEAEPVSTEKQRRNQRDGHWQLSWQIKKGGIGLACLVISVGLVLLLSSILSLQLSFWDALRPTALLIFGLFSIFPKFSFLSLGCTMLGAYFLIDRFIPLTAHVQSGIIWACLILLFGISLLIDALRSKQKHNRCTFSYDEHSNAKRTQDCTIDGEHFTYHGRFCEDAQLLVMPALKQGEISVSFGDYSIDLSKVEALREPCNIKATCSFGELNILIPSRYTVILDKAASFAGVSIDGSPDASPAGTIQLEARASFGEIHIHYVE